MGGAGAGLTGGERAVATFRKKDQGMAVPAKGSGPGIGNDELETYARVALELNGLALSDEDVASTLAEIRRGLEIIEPLLGFELPEGLDQAGVFRP